VKRTPPGFAPWVESQESQLLRARLKGLGNLARIVFLDRNAHGLNKPGMPRRERLAIKKKMRPHLWQAIHWTRKSRDALLAGNVEMHELLRDRARMYRAFAALELFQPYANKYGEGLVQIAARSASGGKAKAAAAELDMAESLAELDGLIKGCMKRGGPYRIREWMEEYGLKRSTLYRRIAKIRAEQI
jgi:hypothetical protein